MKGAVLSASGQSTFNDEEFADSVHQTTKCAFKDDASKQRCGVCGTTNTPCWRKGPSGPKTLCNRCGVHWYQNKDRWEHIVEELRATRADETSEQASAPTRTVIKKKVDPGSAAAHPAVPDSQRCVKSNGRGWRCSQRKVTNYSYCAHHQRNWDGHEKQWRKAFPNLVYPRKSKKGGDPLVRKRKPVEKQGGAPPQGGKRKPVKSSAEGGLKKRGLMLPDKTWASGKANRVSDDSSEPDYVDSHFGKVRAQYERREGLVKEGSGSMMQLVLPSETDELGATRPLEAGYVSEDDDSQLYHGTQLSEEPGESLESAKEVRSPNHADRHPKPEPSLRSDITALSRLVKTTDSAPPADDQRCVMKGGTGWRCPRPRNIGLRYCNYHIEARRARLKEKEELREGLEETGEPLSSMEILLRLQLKRKRSEGETGLTGNGLGLSWKTKMRRRPFSSRGGPVADVKQGSDMSQDSPRPKTVDHPPETEYGGRREEEDDAAYLGVEELRRRLEASRGAIAAQQEKNEQAGRELIRAKEGRLMAERQLEGAKKEAVLGGGDAAEVEKLKKALQAERANASLLRPEALKLADQFKHQAVLLSKQGAHLTHLRTSAQELREEVAALTTEKKELQAQLTQLHKANACTLCTSGKLASTALVPCGHLYCGACTSTLAPSAGGARGAPMTGLLIDAPLRASEAPAKIEAAAIGLGGACDSSVYGSAKLIVENGGHIEKTSKCPCCLVEVKGRLVVHKAVQVDEEMDGAVSLLGLLASESS